MDFLPESERRILSVIRDRSVLVEDIARTLCERKVNIIHALTSRLAKDGVLTKLRSGTYAVSDKGLANFLRTYELCGLNAEDVVQYVQQLAYETFCPVFESLEHRQLIRGNGHHMAQNLMNDIGQEIEKRLTSKAKK